MEVKNVTEHQLNRALEMINQPGLFDGNVEWKAGPTPIGKQFRFTLTVRDCKKKGGRRGYSRNNDGQRRRCGGACWHVHGEFFDALFLLKPEAVVKSACIGVITAKEGNWQDKRMGSQADPVMYSELCDCKGVLAR